VYIKENIVLDTQSVFENFLNIFYFEFQKKESEVSFFAEKIEKIFAEKFERNEENIEIIKNYFDSVLDVYKMTKYFILEKNKKRIEDLETDNNFYNDFYSYYDDFEVWKEYNLVRNYVTKKQVKTEKFKLNFDNSQFLT
jgi:CRISPR-associated protein Cpf1